jgi:hypothetical protein
MRHVALTTTRTLLATTVLATSLAVTGVALAERTRTDSTEAGDERDHRAVLVQVPSCWGTPITTPDTTRTTPPNPADGGLSVTVRIEPTSLLKLDSSGHVIAAETNTGCAPRMTDHIYVVLSNGNLVENTKVDVSDVRWTGDFTEFGFIRQQHRDD